MESSHQYGKDIREIGGIPWRALAWSLGVHALVLLALAPLSPAGETGVPPAQRLLAQLRSAPVPSPAVLPVPEKGFPSVTSTFPVPTKSTKSAASSTLTTQTKSAVVDAPQPTSPSVVAGGEPVAAVVASPSVALPPPPVEPGAPDAAGLRQYRLALASEARRYRRYPEAARRAGLAGTVEVRVSITASGVAAQTELTRSSGHAQLDTAALEMLRLAAERTKLPDALRNRQFAVLLPVVFEVEE
ncbi:MAG: TonB family protein [Rhodocyclaceae bacterium]|nr:TonB family protein [Rhodocyclaceae bacterium]MDZ4213877.1 TonB family protein [Rhodocyclaceae bacterium]